MFPRNASKYLEVVDRGILSTPLLDWDHRTNIFGQNKVQDIVGTIDSFNPKLSQ